MTNTPKRTLPFRQPNFGRRKKARSTSTQGTKTRGSNLGIISQVSTPHRGSSSIFRMAGHYATIRLPKLKGEALEDLKKHLFIYEKI
jgi:hypothetical protein